MDGNQRENSLYENHCLLYKGATNKSHCFIQKLKSNIHSAKIKGVVMPGTYWGLFTVLITQWLWVDASITLITAERIEIPFAQQIQNIMKKQWCHG